MIYLFRSILGDFGFDKNSWSDGKMPQDKSVTTDL